ncbi:PREDICTED: uncharacterized protein LOC104603775 isoform X2 [Nelumbo nucifera]|uniref:Uncharacterized protein LOC104603775 isoform X2 n=2 Tax=Nelumbo nucifera TaxID=4432 RepID=A0A1U8ATK3_NELNU|nr:PREDICTED: uncharacterized protein LOC104603775 isoform X2 [Nelumbo nucifera]XP_010266200.1 PREDICTED: uncharacterized protein LOC104603775 isoform X2 [Nelumbo nucifera]DAD41834.1 TPA_asm: hypothetical protein HUJ06_016157 [Nelumbo nucifera]
MGGILHLFEFNQGRMSRKFLGHNRHIDGLETPRNSLDLPLEPSQSCSTSGNILYSYQTKHSSSRKNCYPSKASMKKLIDEEISRGSDTRRNAPSVVARLMGMDTLPSDTKPTTHAKEKKNQSDEQFENGSIRRSAFGSKSFRKTEVDFLTHFWERDPDLSSSGMKYGKPRSREHPQEDELQKFKKEFEAWQAARVWEHPKVVELGRIPGQRLAEENLNKERKALYTDSRSLIENNKLVEPKCHTSLAIIKGSSQERGALHHQGYKKETFPANQIESATLRNRTKSIHSEQIPLMDCDQKFGKTYDNKLGKSSVPTRIVILKPGPDRNGGSEDSCAGSSEAVEEEGSIEDLLEEVKERLRCEIQGKSAKRDTAVRRGGIWTSFSEKQSDPKEIAWSIAQQVRENVTKGLGINLLRSESTRSYRSEAQVNGQGSSEFINRDTRKFLSEKLRNVVKGETPIDYPPSVGGCSRASALGNEEIRPRPTGGVLLSGNIGGCWEDLRDKPEIQTRSFRHGHKSDAMLYTGELSPRNLIRSLSAPVSGNSFGKLLLEDRHILTGAQIRRKHEATENVSVEMRKKRKERLNFRGKVSKLRYSFTLRGKLFGRKIQAVEESGSNESDSVKDNGPTVVMNPWNAHENLTEVPPSPASVCSSGHEEFCQPVDHLSPISTLDVPLIEDCPMPRVFREISSNLQELKKQLNQLDSDESDDTPIREGPPEAETLEIEIEDEAEAYMRDLLVASGLYDGSFDCFFPKWDPTEKPISNSIYEEVEESYRRRAKGNEEETKDQNESKEDHKLLFDLLNEALAKILGSSSTISRLKRKVLGLATVSSTCGSRKKLLDAAWEMVRMYVHPPMDGSYYSIDSVVARDMETTVWSDMMLDDIDIIVREMSWVNLGELMEETVKDMLL